MTAKRPRKTSRPPRKSQDWEPYDLYLPIFYGRLKVGDFPPREVLADVLKANRDKPYPDWLIDHVCAELRGKVKKKRGRRPQTEWRRRFVELADWEYRRGLSWLKKREMKGMKWPRLINQATADMPRKEYALRLAYAACKRSGEFDMIGLARFRNLISSRK